MVTYILSALLTFVLVSPAYAIDCTTSFDQSCLSEGYDAAQVEKDHNNREQALDAHFKAIEEEEKVAAEIAEKEWQEEEKERRHQERLAVEEAKEEAERQQIRELRTIQNQLQAIHMEQYWQRNR